MSIERLAGMLPSPNEPRNGASGTATVETCGAAKLDATSSNSSSSGSTAAGQGRLGSSSSLDVVLHLEYITDAASRSALAVLRLVVSAAVALLAVEAVWKFRSTAELTRTNKLLILNAVLASCCLVGVLSVGFLFAYRILATLWHGKRWNRRRRVIVTVTGLELLFQVAASGLFLAPNAYSLAVPCAWTLAPTNWMGLGRFLAWNSILALQVLQAVMLLPMEYLAQVLRKLRLEPVLAGSWACEEAAPGLDLPSWVFALMVRPSNAPPCCAWRP